MASNKVLDNFWNDLQNKLKKMGYADLNTKSGAVRLTIIHFDANKNLDENENVFETLAFVPQDKNGYNKKDGMSRMKDSEIMNKLKPGKPNLKQLEVLYNAARCGKLFIHIPEKMDEGPSQVVYTNNEVRVFGDFGDIKNENSKNYHKIIQCLNVKKPASVSFYTRMSALFGNRDAKNLVNRYSANLNLYHVAQKFLNTQEKDDLVFAENQYRANISLFQNDNNPDVADANIRMEKLMKEASMEERKADISERVTELNDDTFDEEDYNLSDMEDYKNLKNDKAMPDMLQHH